jgi:hypothetical protein
MKPVANKYVKIANATACSASHGGIDGSLIAGNGAKPEYWRRA